MAPIVRVTPRVDTPPEHTCGTVYRAGVFTVGCPGCLLRSNVAAPVLASERGRR